MIKKHLPTCTTRNIQKKNEEDLCFCQGWKVNNKTSIFLFLSFWHLFLKRCRDNILQTAIKFSGKLTREISRFITPEG